MFGSRYRYSQCQFLESQIRGATVTIGGKPLYEMFIAWQVDPGKKIPEKPPKRMQARARVSQQAAYDILIAIAITWNQLLQERGFPSMTTCIRRWCKSIEEQDFDVTLKCLKAADDLFLRIISSGEVYEWSYKRFKGAIKAEYPGVGGVLAPLAPLLSACFAGNGDTGIIRDVRQCLSLTRKVWVPLMDPRFAEDAEQAFIDTDTTLESGSPTRELLEFFEQHLSKPIVFRPEYFHHGNGATYGVPRGRSFEFKEMDMSCDILWLETASYLSWPRPLEYEMDWTGKDCRVSRFAAVPKSCEKARGIDLEPTLLQWTQHGIAESVWDYVRNDRYLSRRISKSEGAELNAQLALRGSMDGSLATIDSSSASDTVSLSLYLRCLLCNPSLRAAIVAGRSSYVYLPLHKTTLELRKLAPMGNGYTFIMECIMFAAIVEEAIKLCGDDPRYSVYRIVGDDIVVESCYAEKVIERLAYYGFKPNPEKSYYDRKILWNFRESCGMEALDGEDITPFRLPRDHFLGLGSSAWSTKDLLGYLQDVKTSGYAPWPVSAMALANRSYNGVSDLRLFIVENLLKLPKGLSVRFDCDGERGLTTPPYSDTNFHLKKRVIITQGNAYECTMFGVPKVHRANVFWSRRAKCTIRHLGYARLPSGKMVIDVKAYRMSKRLGEFRLNEWLRLATIRERTRVDREAWDPGCYSGLALRDHLDSLIGCDREILIPEAGTITHVSWESTREISTQCYHTTEKDR